MKTHNYLAVSSSRSCTLSLSLPGLGCKTFTLSAWGVLLIKVTARKLLLCLLLHLGHHTPHKWPIHSNFWKQYPFHKYNTCDMYQATQNEIIVLVCKKDFIHFTIFLSLLLLPSSVHPTNIHTIAGSFNAFTSIPQFSSSKSNLPEYKI